MERASLVNRVNYETRWLSRDDLVRVGYRAVQRLTTLKGEYGALPGSVVRSVSARIDDALAFGAAVKEADDLHDPYERTRALQALGPDIRRRNEEIFFSGVANQSYPVNRAIGGRWFDETLYSSEEFERAAAQEAVERPCVVRPR